MATWSLNDPIDGEELKQIILKRIEDALDRDCTLADTIAYAGFELSYEIKLKFIRSNSPGTLVWGAAKEGMSVGDSDTVTLVDEYKTDSPNTAREEHDLGIPVMIDTPAGRERRKVGRPPKVKP